MKTPIGNRKTDSKKKVFLVEDHPVTRDGFTQIINFQVDLIVCGQASTAGEALKEIPKTKPDVVIVDISLSGGNGLDLIKDLAIAHPGLPTLVLSTHDEKIYAERALRAGSRGYIMKHAPTTHILACIHLVLRGEICLSDAMRSKLLGKMSAQSPHAASGVEALSDRELEVFRLLGEGHSTTQIAASLNVSISTVETYRAHIKEKLGLTNSSELVAAAVRWDATSL